MIRHTKAYERFRKQGIELYDFCVLQSLAIPCLEKQIEDVTGPVIASVPESRFIKNDNITADEVRRRIRFAGDVIGKELLLSTFSYFEAYVSDALNEILDFHGGHEALSRSAARRIDQSDKTLSDRASESRRKIREYPKPSLVQKYKKHLKVLDEEGYLLPSQRMAAYGWNVLSKTVDRLRAERIPDLLKTALLFPISESTTSKFHTLRDTRNKIAHGRRTRYPVNSALMAGTFFRDLAVGIDGHIVEHFMMVEYPPNEL